MGSKDNKEAPKHVAVKTRRQPSQARSVAAVEAILDAAARSLITRGYDETTTSLVASEAGVSVGSLYQYFANKEALVAAVAQRHADRQMQVMAAAAARIAEASLAEVVHTMCAALVEAHRIDPELSNVLLRQVANVGTSHHWEVERAARALVHGLLAARKDEILPDDLETASFVLVTLVEGIVYSAVLQQDAGAPGLDAVQRETEAVVLRYLVGHSTKT
jgi:AcrR family transcriptional regulator